MIQKDPKTGYLCRRVKFREPVTIRHQGEEIRVLAFPVQWEDPFTIVHNGEKLHIHMWPARRNDLPANKDMVYTLVFAGPKTFEIVQDDKKEKNADRTTDGTGSRPAKSEQGSGGEVAPGVAGRGTGPQ